MTYAPTAQREAWWAIERTDKCFACATNYDQSSEAFRAARDLVLRMGEKHLVRWWWR